ncbi:MAG: response regulator [Myxococcales bacterium]|nr:response regulator [Myxococcales bacterium]
MTRVLVVDDNEAWARTTARLLRQHGFQCFGMRSAEAVLTKSSLDRYDVLLVDLVMPGMDGIALCEQLRRRGFRGVVIIVSATDDPDETVRALRAGADDYMVKPVDGKELVARIRARLEPRLQLREIEAAQEPSSRTPSTPDVTPVSSEARAMDALMHVLVVDSDSIRRPHFVQRLAMLGAAVYEAATGNEALQQLGAVSPDCVLIWSAGGPSGDARALHLCQQLRLAAPRMVLLLLSSSFSAPSALQAQAGADLTFPDGINIKMLWFAISSCVHRRRGMQTVLDLGAVQILLTSPHVVVDGEQRSVRGRERKLIVELAEAYPERRWSEDLEQRLGYDRERSPESEPFKQTVLRARDKLAPYRGVIDWDRNGGYGLIHTRELTTVSGSMPKHDASSHQPAKSRNKNGEGR